MKNRFVIGYYNLANLVTMLGLCCALLACFLLAQGNTAVAMLAFACAGLCDMMDGRIARSSGTTGQRIRFYGVQLDSLCDVISFGIVPCFMAFWLGYRDTPDILIYLLFSVCGATRLANFNMEVAMDSPNLRSSHFTGLPIPFSVIIFPLLTIVHVLAGPVAWLFRVVFLLVGLGYILRIRIPKPTGKLQFAIILYELVVLITLLFITL